MGDTLLLAGLVLVGAAVGFAIGKWWALLAAFLIPVAFVAAGENSDARPYWEIALIALTPPAFLGLAMGITGRWILARRN